LKLGIPSPCFENFTAQAQPQPKENQLLTADLRGFTLINQQPLKHGGTEEAEENQNP
jgi:hypothetical protein